MVSQNHLLKALAFASDFVDHSGLEPALSKLALLVKIAGAVHLRSNSFLIRSSTRGSRRSGAVAPHDMLRRFESDARKAVCVLYAPLASLVDHSGLEPLASPMPWVRSTR